MSDTFIDCPSCGHHIPLTQALSAQLRGQLENALKAQHLADIEQAVAEAEQRKLAQLATAQEQLQHFAAQTQELEKQNIQSRMQLLTLQRSQTEILEKAKLELQEQFHQESLARAKLLTEQVEKRVRDESNVEVEALKLQLQEQTTKAQLAQKTELELRIKAQQLEEKQRDLDLEIARRIDSEKSSLEAKLRQSLSEEQDLKFKEKEKQIDDLRKVIDDLKRKSEQGSQELQGEVLELDIQASLEREFPHDRIEPVAKGSRGADIVQRVRNARLEDCGTIVWETKNTKQWQKAWIDKLKTDQRAIGANLAVIVTTAMPEPGIELCHIEGVWIVSRRSYLALALALREQLLQIAFARAASEGKNEKMDMLYAYLAGDQFRHKIQGIVEGFTALQDQLARERRAMEKLWKEREKQIERVITSTVGMYGEMSGILGSSLPEIPALTLEAGLLEGDT
jgi:hypothetical protein